MKLSTRVLIVDDEPSYRDYLERYLERLGFLVRTASNRREALATAEEFGPQIVLADWMLRDQAHGLEVAETLRRRNPLLRVLLMTGFPSAEIRDEAARAQVHTFLEKPFGLEEVAEAIRRAAADLEADLEAQDGDGSPEA